MTQLSEPSLTLLLERLVKGHVEFVLVGGLAAVAQGAPITTMDVDIVHRRTKDNVARLLDVLTEVGGYVREPGSRRLPPRRDALQGPGHQLLITDLGPLDCLGAIEDGLDYEGLLPDTITIALRDCWLRVLTLEKLVELKRHWSDDESRLRAAILERTLKAKP